MTMQVREAAPDERAEIRRLLTDEALPLDGLDQAITVLVAVDNKRIAGTAALEHHGAGDDAAYLLRSVAVRPDARGHGTAADLVRTALAHAERGRPVALLTETASRYFERFGFEPVTWDDLPPALSASAELSGACSTTAQAMLRRA
jgi:amino-acid N-acetyltransferase